MADRATRLAEALAAGLCAFGAALATAPNEVLARAGLTALPALPALPALQGLGLLFARLTGVRDLAFGAALLGTRGATARRRLLRVVAAVAFADALLLLLGRGRLPARRVALGAAASLATGALAVVASTGADDLESGGVPLLVAGSLLSAAPALDLATVVRERRSPPFVAFEVGAALLGAGWLRRGSRAGAAINGGAALGGLLWWIRGARHGSDGTR